MDLGDKVQGSLKLPLFSAPLPFSHRLPPLLPFVFHSQRIPSQRSLYPVLFWSLGALLPLPLPPPLPTPLPPQLLPKPLPLPPSCHLPPLPHQKGRVEGLVAPNLLPRHPHRANLPPASLPPPFLRPPPPKLHPPPALPLPLLPCPPLGTIPRNILPPGIPRSCPERPSAESRQSSGPSPCRIFFRVEGLVRRGVAPAASVGSRL